MCKAERWLFILVVSSVLWPANGTNAAQVTAVPDRTRIQLGEEFVVTVRVRGSRTRPVIELPEVPGCQIEPMGQLRSRPVQQSGGNARDSSAAARRGAALPQQPLGAALQEMERLQSRTLDTANMQGLLNTALIQEYQSLLSAYRQQALEALSGPQSLAYEMSYRIIPHRAGILTLPPFAVTVGNQEFQTQPLELTIEPPGSGAAPQAPSPASPPSQAAAAIDKPAGSRPALPSLHGGTTVLGKEGVPIQSWPWLLALLAVPPVLFAVVWRGQRWWQRRVARLSGSVRRDAVREAKQHMLVWSRTTSAPEAVAEGLTLYLRIRCNLPEGEITPVEATRCLEAAAVQPAVAQRFAGLLDRCAAARFAPGGAVALAEENLVEEAQQVIDEVERSGRWRC
jgi:hypothetical protein